MKKAVFLWLAVLLLAGSWAGCGPNESPTADNVFTAADNIYTYERPDPEKTQLIVSVTGNIYITDLCAAFEEQNPDVQIIEIDISGGNGMSVPVKDWLQHGQTPDVMFWAGNPLNAIRPQDHFLELSTRDYLNNFEAESINRVTVDGKVYFLPGPSQIGGLLYNRTMFAQYGWELPKTFAEFVMLCQQIRQTTNGQVEPWNPNAKYGVELIGALEAFSYSSILEGPQNQIWYEDFLVGEASFVGHMQPFYDRWQQLIEAGIVREDHFFYSATTRANEFKAGKIAIINSLISENAAQDFEVGFMPYCGETEQDAYLLGSTACYVGITKSDARSAQVQNAADRFVAYYSTPQAQTALIGDHYMISNVKNVPASAYAGFSELQRYLRKGRIFSRAEFKDETMLEIYVPCDLLRRDLLAILKGEMTAGESMQHLDQANQAVLAGSYETDFEVVATAAEDFTILETSHYFADMFREKAGADIGLIANNVAYRGNVMRIFPGDITTADVQVLKPRSLDNHSKLIKVSMSGEQLLEALNNPLGKEGTADCIYAFSGLKCEVAAHNPLGERYLTVTLEDGTALDPVKLFSVAVWEGTVADRYIAEVLAVYPGSFEELLSAKMRREGSITPARDGRIKLIWPQEP